VGLSEEGEGGGAHDEGFAGGGGACVWEGVEGQVEVVVGVEVFLCGWGEGAEVEAGGVDVVLGEALEEFGFEFVVGEFGGFDEEFCVGALVEDFGPEVDGGGGEFFEVVEGAEGEGARRIGFVDCGEGTLGGGWLVAEEAAGEADEFFGGEVVGSGWVGDVVDESCVDSGEACGVAVADEGDLDGCGGGGEDGEFVSGEVACEFDEDVDVLGFDVFDELGEGHGVALVPVVGVGVESLGDFITVDGGGEDVGLVVCFVGVFEDGFEEVGDGVLVEVS